MSEADENNVNEPIPDGMVRKKRRVRKRRSSTSERSSDKEEANRLFAKAKELLIGMHDEDEAFGPVDVAEQLRRLKRKKEDDRPLDDVWGTKKRSTSWLWIILAGIIASVIAVVVGLSIWTNQDVKKVDRPSSFFLGDENLEPLANDALTWFFDDSITILDEAKKIIGMLNQRDELDAIDKRLRESAFRGDATVNFDDWGSPLLTNARSQFSWSANLVNSSKLTGSKERGYVSLTGKRENGNPFEVFFVQGNENQLVLDWDASIGWSEMSVGQMAKKLPQNEVFLRCRIGKKPGYDQSFGQDNYSGYVLTGEVPDEFVFAYVNLDRPGGKLIDRNFRLLLNYGSFVSNDPPLQEQKVSLRLKFDSEIGAEGQFEIVEYLNDGWVTP
ncbi:hypothetical protein N8659_01260 [bacterium]|nr:hypothetical protein [bacterium]MDB4490538.1 hypothetical protein [bacterium]MDB4750219.1 hypothetical protein [bacterium]